MSPTSRSSRRASASTISSERVALLGILDERPPSSAATWPRIAVSGVRSSCETDIRKFRSRASDSISRSAISSNRSARWPISPGAPARQLDVVVAGRDLVGRVATARAAAGRAAARRTSANAPATSRPNATATASRRTSEFANWLIAVFCFATTIAPIVAVPDRDRVRDRVVGAVRCGGVNSNVSVLPDVQSIVLQVEPRQARVLARERARPGRRSRSCRRSRARGSARANVGARRESPRFGARSRPRPRSSRAARSPSASRRSSWSVWSRAKSRKSWIAISVVTTLDEDDPGEEEERQPDAEGREHAPGVAQTWRRSSCCVSRAVETL